MGAAISIFVLLSLSTFIVRVAAVAMRLTGLDESTARFQSLSAFTGTGFTTSEAERIVNYPVRRRIVTLLMIIGNLGIVGVGATVVVSLVQTEGEAQAVAAQLGWLLAGLALLWILMLNKTADRVLCAWIGRFLEARTVLGKRPFHRLLQVSDGFSVCEHPAPAYLFNDTAGRLTAELERGGLVLLGVWSADGEEFDASPEATPVQGSLLVLAGSDQAHDGFANGTLRKD